VAPRRLSSSSFIATISDNAPQVGVNLKLLVVAQEVKTATVVWTWAVVVLAVEWLEG
jgi:hypothetical protein